jgi:tetratricopeptide (TPR) repeat protein
MTEGPFHPPPCPEDQDRSERTVASPGYFIGDLLADQQARWHRGERWLVEAYLARHPGLAANAEAVLDLIGNEVLLRREQGEAARLDEYLRRFPQLAGPIRVQFEVEHAIESGSLTQARGSPGGSTSPHVPAAAAEGGAPHIAGYEILGVLGKGGMGVVYQARQVGLERLVALKVIRAEAHAHPAHLARFRQEAEAVARLQHPHIVQIYEVGEQDGLPFLSLEFVPGGTLAQHLAGKPQPPREAARLLETLARAMHHAHERGVVHRDLKPANILLQEKSEIQNPKSEKDGGFVSDFGFRISDFHPKITDFGLAKRLEGGPGHTQTGDILGTPSYMAPEQAAGRAAAVGPAADVYALGAVLYEMLMGRPPFQGETPWDTVLQVMSHDPVPPARLQPRVPRDLETICLKCLEKEPKKRYASAHDLAEDLHRFLAGEPIRARPAGATERALKWAKRRPAAAALVAFGVLALLGLLLAGVWYNRRLEEEVAAEQRRRQEAERERAATQFQREKAEANFRAAREAVDQMLTRVAQNPLANVPHMTPVRRQLLEDALRFYRRFLRRRGSDAEVRRETARAYRRLGDIGLLLGRHAQAGKDYLRAIALQEKLSAEYPGVPAYRQDLEASHTNRGHFLRETRQPAKAEGAFRHALALAKQLAADFPGVPAHRKELADRHFNLGTLLSEVGRPGEAEKCYAEALRLQEKLVTEFPNEAELRVGLARSFSNLGLLLQDRGRPGQAEKALRRSIAARLTVRGARAETPEYRFDLANSYNALGVVLWGQDRLREAEDEFRKAARIQRRLTRDFPSVPDYRSQLGGTLSNLGVLLFDQGALAEARRLLEEAVRGQQDALRANPQNPFYRDFLRKHAAALADTLLKLNDAIGAAAAARIPLPYADGWQDYYAAAHVLARCVRLVEKDAKLPEARRRALAEEFAGRAVGLLREAVRSGYQDAKALRKDPAFEALRARDDFRSVLAALRKKG